MTIEQTKIELIDMLTIIKMQALKSNNDTVIIDVNIDSFNFVINNSIKAIKELGPKKGRWIEHFDESGSVNYCPNCGVKME